MPANLSTKKQPKMIPMESVRELTRGSFNELLIAVDEAVVRNRSTFVGESEVGIGAIATFPDHVVVGTEDGEYFDARYARDREGNITFEGVTKLEVPVVDGSSREEFVRRYTLETVDAILFGKKEEAASKVLALLQLEEGEEDDNIAVMVAKLLGTGRPWRRLYAEQKAEISQLSEAVYPSVSTTPKYVGLYDGTVPEEKFPSYRDSVTADLSVVADRLELVQTEAETAFYRFTESVGESDYAAEDSKALQQFAAFAEDFIEDIHSLREHVAYALNEEPCVMCMAQVHDAVADAMYDYRVAGSFVAQMSQQLAEQQ